jgi:hypothetical protein
VSSSISHLLTVRQAATAARRASNLTGCVTLREAILRDVTVDADGKRLAKNVAKSLGQFFVTQGWISPSALN